MRMQIRKRKKKLTQAELHDWVTYYYKHPDPEKTQIAVLTLHDKGHLGEPNAVAPLSSFLSFVFKQLKYIFLLADLLGYASLTQPTTARDTGLRDYRRYGKVRM
jgi:hypothetical protein